MDLNRPIDGLEVAVIDTETTGIDFDGAGVHVVSVAVVHMTLGRNRPDPVVAFSSLVRPPCPIPPDATKIHGITDADVADAPEWADVAARLPLDGRMCAAFNAPYDFRATGGVRPWPWTDVAIPAKEVDRYKKGKRLADVAARRGIGYPAHGAVADAMVAALLLPMLFRELANPRIRTLGDLLAWQRTTALAQEQDLAAYLARGGNREPFDFVWHRLEGVDPGAPSAPAFVPTTIINADGTVTRKEGA